VPIRDYWCVVAHPLCFRQSVSYYSPLKCLLEENSNEEHQAYSFFTSRFSFLSFPITFAENQPLKGVPIYTLPCTVKEREWP